MLNKYVFTYILGCTILVAPLRSHAQTWFPPEAEWHFFYGGSGGSALGYVHVIVDEDTIINGTQYKNLKKIRTAASYLPPQQYVPFSDDLGSTFLQEVHGLVKIYNVGTLEADTLYNMNAAPGDHWMLANWPSLFGCSQNSFTIVLDTGTVFNEGHPLHWLAVENHFLVQDDPESSLVVPDTIMERMGALNDYLYPHDQCFGMIDGNEGGPLHCYHDDDISFESPPSWYSVACDGLPTGIIEQVKGSFNIYPNPGSDVLYVDRSCSTGPFDRIELFDLRGRSVLKISAQQQLAGLDVSSLAPGPYLLRVIGSNSAEHRVWVKE